MDCGNEKPDADQKFYAFHQRNPEFYAKLVEITREAKARGLTRLGARTLFEVCRWGRLMSTPMIATDGDGWVLNNTFASRYARLIMDLEPDLRGMFELRELKT